MFSLADKTALITGACSGIGLAIVKRFVTAGAQVIGADLRTNPEFNSTGATFIELDVSRENQLALAFAEVEEKYGKLDILINNAGIALEEGPLGESSVEVMDKTFSVNLQGVLLGLKYGPRHMRNGGSIINTASLAAAVTMPGYTAYSISKAGVVKLSQQAAVELSQRGIRVNAVCPGTTTTPMEPKDSDESQLCRYLTAARRPGTPEEQAAVFHFLASDDASYVNAQAIHVDGGWVHGLNYALVDKLLDRAGQK